MAENLLGSARFATTRGEVAADDFLNLQDQLLIGHPINSYGRTQQTILTLEPKRHVLSIAPNRSGKGATLIVNNLLNYAGSVLVIDPKGENTYLTAARRRALGQKTIILDPWGEVNRRYGQKTGVLEEVSKFNPLSILDPCSTSYADDLAYLADALIISQSKSDPFFDDSARDLVAGLMAYAVEKYGAAAEIDHVRRLVRSPSSEIAALAAEAAGFGKAPAEAKPSAKGRQTLARLAREKRQAKTSTPHTFESLAAQKLAAFAVPGKTLDNILMTARSQLQFLDSDPLLDNMAVSDFSFDDLTERPTTIYLVLPVDKLDTKGRWLRLMVSIAIRQIARNQKLLSLPVLFMLDEFGTIGRLSAVARAFGLMSGLQMCVWAFLQDLNQLKRDYPQEWETFISNAEGVTLFGAMDNFTTEYFARMCGKTTVEFEQRNNKQHFQRDLMSADEIRRFRHNLLITRQGPFRYAGIPYFKHPFFRNVARQDPFYATTPETQNTSAAPSDIRAERKKFWDNIRAACAEDAKKLNYFDCHTEGLCNCEIYKGHLSGLFSIDFSFSNIFFDGSGEGRRKTICVPIWKKGARPDIELFLTKTTFYHEQREIETNFSYIYEPDAGVINNFYNGPSEKREECKVLFRYSFTRDDGQIVTAPSLGYHLHISKVPHIKPEPDQSPEMWRYENSFD